MLNSTLDPSNDSANAARRFADKAEELRRKTNALKSDAKVRLSHFLLCKAISNTFELLFVIRLEKSPDIPHCLLFL